MVVVVKRGVEEVTVTQRRMTTLQGGKLYGRSRSLVRRIASQLPLTPCVRTSVQPRARWYGGGAAELTLADIVWIVEDEGEAFTRLRTEVRPEVRERGWLGSQLSAAAMMLAERGGGERGLVGAPECEQQRDGDEQGLEALWKPEEEPGAEAAQSDAAPVDAAGSGDDAMRKISALEEELARLRAQIAAIVAVHEQQAAFGASVVVPVSSTLPDGAVAVPPPPPLPPPGAGESSRASTLALIQQRRAEKRAGEGGAETADAASYVPNMMDVLKGMGKVKLRTVDRSPAGTPAKGKPGEVDEDDPVAMIAAALRRKFAHRYGEEASPERGSAGLVRPPAPLARTGPEQPKFGQHMLRATNRRKSEPRH